VPRPIWKGGIAFGLVNIPVSLYPASEASEEISFRQLHRKDLAPIQYRRVCSAEGTEVPWGEIVKGYEYAKGEFVVMSDEDLAKARVEATQAIDVRDFVQADEIPWTFFENAYYVEPSKQGLRAYALFREALKQTGKVGIGTIVLRQREHLTALRPIGEVLVAAMLKFAHELRSPDALNLPRDVEVDQRELKLAVQLVDTLAGTWKPEQYRDTYTDVLRQAIQQKLEGKEISTAAPKPRPQVHDLMEALRESLKGRPLAKAEPRAAASKRKAAAESASGEPQRPTTRRTKSKRPRVA
jgi:DNA end-binding protein Ku